MKKILFLFILGTALVSACKKSSTTPGYTPDCSGAAKSFATNVSPIVQQYCTGCHAKYASYAGISGDKAAIRVTIADGSMPTNTALTTAQKNSVVCWIDSGAANN